MDSVFADALKRYKRERKRTIGHIHSDLHALADEIRTHFNETAKSGKGSFSFYLGYFQRLGVNTVRRLYAEARESSNGRNYARLFWWKVGKEIRDRKAKSIHNTHEYDRYPITTHPVETQA